jgi:methenyltetrahydromethanopterin cyclohydrolase
LDIWDLNQRALEQLERARPHFAAWAIEGATIADAQVWDFRSPRAPHAAGQLLAAVSAGGGLQVAVEPSNQFSGCHHQVSVQADHPVPTCLAAQYAGWPLSCPPYFAMVSGPLRGLRGREPIFQHFEYDTAGAVERPSAKWLAVLESDHLPPPEAVRQMADDCHCPAEQLVLCVAGTASPAGTLQVVARSLETALHQYEVLGGPLDGVLSGHGRAPLPPLAGDSLTAIGWTNDAIIFAGEVCLQVAGDWERLQTWAAQLPSCNSPSFGVPFLQLFRQAKYDFYQLDPRLFSPAVVRLEHPATGQTVSYGQLRPDLLQASWQGSR